MSAMTRRAPEVEAAPSCSPLRGRVREEIEQGVGDGIRCLLGLVVAGVDDAVPERRASQGAQMPAGPPWLSRSSRADSATAPGR